MTGNETALVKFLPSGREVRAAKGKSVLEICIENDIDLPHNCGGVAACLSCHVIVREGRENLSPPEEKELDKLDEVEGSTLASRLGCQARVLGECAIEIPKRAGK